MRLLPPVEPADISIGLTRDEYVQARVDAAVKKGLVPADRRLDPAYCERVRGDDATPYHLVVVAPGIQVGNSTTKRREEPTC